MWLHVTIQGRRRVNFLAHSDRRACIFRRCLWMRTSLITRAERAFFRVAFGVCGCGLRSSQGPSVHFFGRHFACKFHGFRQHFWELEIDFESRESIFWKCISHANFTFFDRILDRFKWIARAEGSLFEGAFCMKISRFSTVFWTVWNRLRRPRVHFLKVYFACKFHLFRPYFERFEIHCEGRWSTFRG